MSEKSVQNYIDEAMQMYKRAKKRYPDYRAVSAAVDEGGKGGLIINVTTIRELYPVENAKVTVFKGTMDNMVVIDKDITNENGKTKRFLLPTPKKELSEKPETGITPYAVYNIATEADGYVKQYNLNVPVFDGVTSMQAVNLVLISAVAGNTSPNIVDESKSYEL